MVTITPQTMLPHWDEFAEKIVSHKNIVMAKVFIFCCGDVE